MFQKSLIFISTLIIAWGSSAGQNGTAKNNFIMPITGVLGVTGSFGEVRPDHFHSGVDLRTENRIGMEVRAVSDGYVSRIYVSPNGFGKAIFVDHPNGVTSVYAHMNGFYPLADKYIKNYQYEHKTFAADVFPKANELPVKKGDLLGYSGNSGGSFGPHLHYELRTTYNQWPINPIPDYLNVIDTIAPIVKSLHLFRIDSASYANGYGRKFDVSISKKNGIYTSTQNIAAFGKIGVGIDVYDRLNSYSTQCGFNSITLKVNGKQIYNLTLDKFSYAETRYANSIIDYATKFSTGKEIIKLFVDQNNFYSGLRKVIENGYITVKPDSTYKIDILTTDASKNTSTVSFCIKGIVPPVKPELKDTESKNTIFISSLMDKTIINDTFILTIPKNSLYNDLYFTYGFSVSPLSPYSPIVQLHNPLTPVHQKIVLSIKSSNLPLKYQKKALLATYDASKKAIPAGGEWSKGYVKSMIRSFGEYFVAVDTIAPQIVPLNIKSGSNMVKVNNIQFTVKDNFSGIKSINGYIDGQWVLFDYDQKNNLIAYYFDKNRLKGNSNHTLKVVVNDDKENESTYSCNFFW